MRKKGFTLVELLAVIVILAIIAVIAVPQVLKIIEGSREDAFKASVKSVIKAAELAVTKDTTGTLTGGDIKDLDIDNNPFEGGEWYYDKTTKKVIIYEARDKENIAESKYVITGDKEEINSNNLILAQPGNTNPNLLINKIKGQITTICDATNFKTQQCIVGDSEPANKGYIRGPQEGVDNYVKFNDIDWRVVKINADGSILMVTENNVGSTQYDSAICLKDEVTKNVIGGCSSNFAKSSIKTYLNTIFYETIINKKLIKSNLWDTRCSNSCYSPVYDVCPFGGSLSTISKVGLLTLKDYLAVKNGENMNYLNNGNFWWLGTGHNLYNDSTWVVVSNGGNGSWAVNNGGWIRPAVVLNSGITIAGGNGTQTTPYTIE